MKTQRTDSADPPSGRLHPLRLTLLATAVIAVAIVVVAFLPENPGVPGWDGVEHFVAFAALIFPGALLLARAFPWLLAAAIAFGGVLELAQPMFGRQASWSDFLADAFGACAGLALGLTARLLMARRARHRLRPGRGPRR